MSESVYARACVCVFLVLGRLWFSSTVPGTGTGKPFTMGFGLLHRWRDNGQKVVHVINRLISKSRLEWRKGRQDDPT
jgi:hypothetical protein